MSNLSYSPMPKRNRSLYPCWLQFPQHASHHLTSHGAVLFSSRLQCSETHTPGAGGPSAHCIASELEQCLAQSRNPIMCYRMTEQMLGVGCLLLCFHSVHIFWNLTNPLQFPPSGAQNSNSSRPGLWACNLPAPSPHSLLAHQSSLMGSVLLTSTTLLPASPVLGMSSLSLSTHLHLLNQISKSSSCPNSSART